MLALLNAVQTANTNQRERALAAAFPTGLDPDAGHTGRGDRHYREVGGSARDMPVMTTRQIQERALAMRQYNPLGRRYIDLVRELCTQTEWTVEAEDDAVGEVLEDFWAGPYNQWPQWIGSYGDVLNITGVLALPVWVNPWDGQVNCGYADPAELGNQRPQPGNPRRILDLQWQPPKDSDEYQREPYTLTVVNPITATKGTYAQWRGRLMAEDPRTRKRPTGVLYFRSASLPNETVGISDLSAAIDPLANHESFMAAQLELAMVLGRFAGEVILKGPSGEPEVQKVMTRLREEPMFASLAVHNDQEEHKYHASPSMAVDAAERDRMHGNYAMASTGIPPHIARGDMGEGNRAIASQANDPVYLKVQAKLKALVRVATVSCQYAIDSAIICGKLPASVDDTFSINTPQLLKKDLATGSQTAIAIGQALVLAEQREWMGKNMTQEVFVRILPELGVDDISLDDIREDLAANPPEHSPFGGGGFGLDFGRGDEDDDGAKGGGPYLGPEGGKYADPDHTIPWTG